MNIGIMTINDLDFHPNARLKQAAQKLEHNIILINPYNITAGIEKGILKYFIDETTDGLDIVMPRQGSPMGDYGLVLLRQFNKLGISLVNNLNGITIARNQYITLQVLASSGIMIPDTCFITKKENFAKAVEQLRGFPIIVKQVDGMGGEGVIKVNDEKDAYSFLERNLKSKKGVLVQEFLPPEKRMDIRILVIGGKVAGAMKLKPLLSDFRANIHLTGEAEKFDISRDLEQLALKSAKACSLEIAGIDLIIKDNGLPVVIEINYSPGFKGLETATGFDIAEQMIKYVTSIHDQKHHMEQGK